MSPFSRTLLLAAAMTLPTLASADIPEASIKEVLDAVSPKVPAAELARLETGVRQAARLWTESDGTPAEFAAFCAGNFAVGVEKDLLLDRFDDKLESLYGHFRAMGRELSRELDEDRGELKPVDKLFAAYSPSAHLSEDLFKSKLAFLVVLNFPIRTLEESLAQGQGWTRRQWAETRLAQSFAFRVPAGVLQQSADIGAKAEEYVYSYNIRMDALVDAEGRPQFRPGLSLITHWGLRDELKSLYADPQGRDRQKLILTVMERIINQEVPAAVKNNPALRWDPVRNTVDGKPAEREPDTRFAVMQSLWRAALLVDPYYPGYGTLLDRIFRLEREIPESEVEAMLTALLEAPAGRKTAALISARLGRKLLPFDIWYDGFKPPKGMKAEDLDAILRKKYPTTNAFQGDIPSILGKLGFTQELAEFLASRIEVDAARGAGHASGPGMKADKAHLRTRVGKDGMDYQGFNVAMHELGHTVEQTLSMHKVDHYLLNGVPNSAFTEGFAFVFQGKDLEVLGLAKPDEKAEALKALHDFWGTREIAGVALVEMRAWHWMYEHPDAPPAQVREAVVAIAKDVWNKYYAPIFGVAESPILAVYSHMLYYGLYLANYPLGHIIAFQVEDYFKTHPLGADMERMCRLGSITPQEWMRQAVGGPISIAPMVGAADQALSTIDPPPPPLPR